MASSDHSGDDDFESRATGVGIRASYLLRDEAIQIGVTPPSGGAYGDWGFRKEKQGVMIYSKEAAAGDASGGTARCFLGKGRIGLPARLVFDFLCDDEARSHYDKLLEREQTVQTIDDSTAVAYYCHSTKKCLMKKKFDFCVVRHRVEDPDGRYFISAAASIDHPFVPEYDSARRGTVFASGWFVEPSPEEDGTCWVTYLVQVDLGMKLPKMVLKMIGTRQPLCVAYARDYLADHHAAQMIDAPLHDQGAPSEAGQTTTATSNDGGDAAASFGGALSRSVTEMTGTSWRDVDTLSGDSDSSGDPAVDGGEEGSSLARNNTFAARHSGVSAEFAGNT